MRRFFTVFIALSTCFVSMGSLANIEMDGNVQLADMNPTTVNGYFRATDQTINRQMIIDGAATISNSIVNDALHVNGMLNANDTRFNAVNVSGGIYCVKCAFSNTLTINSSSATLSASTTQEIRMNFNGHQTPTIILDKGTHVKGDIAFLKSAGLVIMRNGSTITGKVINGTLKQHADTDNT